MHPFRCPTAADGKPIAHGRYCLLVVHLYWDAHQAHQMSDLNHAQKADRIYEMFSASALAPCSTNDSTSFLRSSGRKSLTQRNLQLKSSIGRICIDAE